MTDSSTLPSDTLAFFDGEGVLFGVARIAPGDRPDRIDCIFDFPDELPSRDPSARWLAKRHYRQWSEHRLTLGADGSLTIKKGSFSIVLDPDEESDGFVSRPPAPSLSAAWE